MAILHRQRWNACDIDGVPSWKLKLFKTHSDVSYTNEKGVIVVKLSNNKQLCLDKSGRVTRVGKSLYCTGFLETEKPTNGQLSCFREEWAIVE